MRVVLWLLRAGVEFVVLSNVHNRAWRGLLLRAMSLPALVPGVAGPWWSNTKKWDLWVLALILVGDSSSGRTLQHGSSPRGRQVSGRWGGLLELLPDRSQSRSELLGLCPCVPDPCSSSPRSPPRCLLPSPPSFGGRR